MQVTEQSADSSPKQVAHRRAAVERWLTFSGLIPLPAFLVLHLGRELWLAWATDVSELVRAEPSLLGLATSLILVWAPLLVHAALGVSLLVSGRRARAAEPAPSRDAAWLGLSRFTSWGALAFVLYHARQYPIAVWLGEADARDAGLRLVAELSSTRFGVPLSSGAYLLGLAATVAHAGLAVHRALLGEGFLQTAGRRQISARACTAAASLLFGVGAIAVIRVASGVFLR